MRSSAGTPRSLATAGRPSSPFARASAMPSAGSARTWREAWRSALRLGAAIHRRRVDQRGEVARVHHLAVVRRRTGMQRGRRAVHAHAQALPVWRLQAADPLTAGSLAAILDRLRGNSRVHVMHNADDFLADRRSIDELKEALGDHMTLYPYGGHLGNAWYPKNREFVLRFFGQ